jgi:hypothetical protein
MKIKILNLTRKHTDHNFPIKNDTTLVHIDIEATDTTLVLLNADLLFRACVRREQLVGNVSISYTLLCCVFIYARSCTARKR